MIEVVGTFIGGLGLFLLAVSMITEGLKLAAGDALRAILAHSTRTRLRGVASGVLVTAVVQSSSAVTVATIGFVNAGLLSLSQSLGVVYGANIGTTMTGWIVAAIGFSFKVEAFALPLIGLGMIARLVRPESRIGWIGQALTGFGLFFIGVDLLKDAFEAFAANVDVGGFAPQGGVGILLYLLLGFFMTVVTQSSSAAIAITLTAATGGVLGLNAAAAMVIGANVGTTSTAALAVIGATANARRVAAAHVAFNLLTGLVALALLPGLLWLVRSTGSLLDLQDVPAVSLALFHTVFNTLGVLLMWPLTSRLAGFLAARFATEAERLGRPQYLDENVMATPVLAMDALQLELARLLGLVRSYTASVLSAEQPRDRATQEREHGILALIEAVETFVTKLELVKLPESRKGELPGMLRITAYLEEVIGLARDLVEHRPHMDAIMEGSLLEAVASYQAVIVTHVERCDPGAADFSSTALDEAYEALRRDWHALKSVLLEAAARREAPVAHLNPALEGLRGCLKIAEQLTKVAVRLHTVQLPAASTDHESAAQPDPEPESDSGTKGDPEPDSAPVRPAEA